MNKKETSAEAMARWEKDEHCKRGCAECQPYYDAVSQGKMPWEVFMPRHRGSDLCKSGKRPHCSCGECF
jgi:hypothetical protein